MEREQKKAIECLKPWNHLVESPCNGFTTEQRHLFSALGQAHRRAGEQEHKQEIKHLQSAVLLAGAEESSPQWIFLKKPL